MRKKVLTVLLIGLVVCFMAQPITLQAEESDPVKAEFSLVEDYSAPLVIPTVVKLESAMLQTVKAPEMDEGKKGLEPFVFISFSLLAAFCFGCMIQTR